MFTATANQILQPVDVAVTTAEMSVAEFVVQFTAVLTVQIENLDSTQVFAGRVQRRLDPAMGWASSPTLDFAVIGPGETVVADLDVRGSSGVRIVGAASGAGLNVRVTARSRASS